MDETRYVDDVPFIAAFHPEQGPMPMTYASRVSGVGGTPDPTQPFVYCDLGCGSGLTLNALAASLPHGRFYGVDLMPAHIAEARSLAEAAGLTNVSFMEADFRAVREGDDTIVPAGVDFFVAHGVWSWVGKEVRDAILRIVDARLKPGGLFLLTYNALPGWAPLRPLRDAMLLFSAGVEGGSIEKARHALGVLKRLRDEGAPYFDAVQSASRMLDQLLGADERYVAHEFFNDAWEPFYVHDVATQLAEADLHFAATLPLHLNDPSLSVRDTFVDLVHAAPHPLLAELTRDILIHETFREDVFVKGEPCRLDTSMAERLAWIPHGTTLSRAQLGRPHAFRHRRLAFDAPVFRPLCDALAGGAELPSELCHRCEPLSAIEPETVAQAILALVMSGQAQPFVSCSSPRMEPASGVGLSLRGRFNQAALDHQLWLAPVVVLSSDVTGQPLELPFVDALVLRGLVEVGNDDLVDWAIGQMQSRDRTYLDREGLPASLEVLRRDLEQARDAFITERLPGLMEARVVVVGE